MPARNVGIGFSFEDHTRPITGSEGNTIQSDSDRLQSDRPADKALRQENRDDPTIIKGNNAFSDASFSFANPFSYDVVVEGLSVYWNDGQYASHPKWVRYRYAVEDSQGQDHSIHFNMDEAGFVEISPGIRWPSDKDATVTLTNHDYVPISVDTVMHARQV